MELINCEKLWSTYNNNIDTNVTNENFHFNKIYFGEVEVINVRSCRALITIILILMITIIIIILIKSTLEKGKS